MAATVIPVPVPGAAYDIHVGEGLLDQLHELLQRHCPAAHYVIVTDSDVAPLLADRVHLAIGGARVSLATFTAGERHKTRDTWSAITDQMLATGVGRDGAVLALGGGVVGDVAGFVAATYMRGLPCVQLPTTLLAMIDSSVGGKTGVDTHAGKNLVGAFHQPRLVVADVGTLRTLPDHHLAAGMAEALKHGAIADRNYFERLVAIGPRILDRDPGALAETVTGSVRIKADVVSSDEKEQGRRAILNFGHTIGHAVEAASDYGMLHGEAISIGMVAEAELGVRLGITDAGDVRRLTGALEAFGLPTRMPPGVPKAALLSIMKLDKKARAGTVRFSFIKRLGEVARGAGDAWTVAVSEKDIQAGIATL